LLHAWRFHVGAEPAAQHTVVAYAGRRHLSVHYMSSHDQLSYNKYVLLCRYVWIVQYIAS
jgi:hypothetical protein